MANSRPQSRPQPKPLWLCLYFYSLPLDQLRLGDAEVAIADKQRIVFASEAAQAAGIYPDMRLATAYALQPDIKVVERKPEREAEALQGLTEWGYQFTPTVTAYKDFSVLLEIGGSLSLFKGLRRLLNQIDRDLSHRGFHHCGGLAHTKEAAWMFSHYRADRGDSLTGTRLPATALSIPGIQTEMNEFSPPDPAFWLPQLRSLPLHYLDINRKKQQQLFNMGLTTLGDLLALPSQDLGKRFGKELLELLASIAGDTPALDVDFKPAQTFTAQLDFGNGITKLDELNGPLEEILSQLLRFLHQHQLYIQELEWQFYYFKQSCDKLLIHTSAANNNLKSLLSLSKIKLEQYSLKAPLESLSLSTHAFTPATASSGDLFPELSHPSKQLSDYRQLLDKLLTRLGDNCLTTLSVGDEHLPEYQQVSNELSHQDIDDIGVSPHSTKNASQRPLPLWLTQKPIPIAAPNEAPGPLRLVYGPQRVDSHWWQQRCRRDYFVARHQNGSYCWVFRDLNKQRWFLQGFYG